MKSYLIHNHNRFPTGQRKKAVLLQGSNGTVTFQVVNEEEANNNAIKISSVNNNCKYDWRLWISGLVLNGCGFLRSKFEKC
mmetsp:Transcript_20375/g.30614  ORF Transcript_20375/g.30614 Transcript_20375/m.30614 type:complete len:81 (-) Transcript_20375:584-826(-)